MIDPPWRLDPLKNIVEVGWGGGPDILVVRLFYHWSREDVHPVFQLDQLPWDFTIHNPFIETLNEDDGTAAIIVNPINGEMLARLYLWSEVPKQVVNSEIGFDGYALLFFNLRKIRAYLTPEDTTVPAESFSIRVRTPEASFHIETGVLYWLWGNTLGASSFEENMAVNFTTGDPFTGELIGFPKAFTDEALRDTYLAAMNSGDDASTYFPHDEIVNTTISDGLEWSVQGWTFSGLKDFGNLSDKFTAPWQVSHPKQKHKDQIFRSQVFGTNLPSSDVIVAVTFEDLTISVED